MIASTWGAWHHEIHLDEAMSLPICFPKDERLRKEIVGIVDALMSWPTHNLLAGDILGALAPLEQALDEAIFKLYGLSESERDLVLDLCEVNLEFLYQDSKSNAVRSVERFPSSLQGTIKNLPGDRKLERGLEGYLYAFLKMWNREIMPQGEFRWRIIRPSHLSMIAVVFTTQEMSDPLPIIDKTDEEEWDIVLKRCSNALRQ